MAAVETLSRAARNVQPGVSIILTGPTKETSGQLIRWLYLSIISSAVVLFAVMVTVSAASREQRQGEMGLLQAVGFTPSQLRLLLDTENLLLTGASYMVSMAVVYPVIFLLRYLWVHDITSAAFGPSLLGLKELSAVALLSVAGALLGSRFAHRGQIGLNSLICPTERGGESHSGGEGSRSDLRARTVGDP